MSNRTTDSVFCANDGCDNEAECKISDTQVPLCGSCGTMWEWGHAAKPDVSLTSFEQE